MADHIAGGRNTQFALAACAGMEVGRPRHGRTSTSIEVGIYLGSGEGSLDFEAFTGAAINSWQADKQAIDAVKWAELASEEDERHASWSRSRTCRSRTWRCSPARAGRRSTASPPVPPARRRSARRPRSSAAAMPEVMIGGGAHSMIHPFGVTGFNRLTALSTANDNPRAASRAVRCQPRRVRAGRRRRHGDPRDARSRQGSRREDLSPRSSATARTADAYRITDQDPDGLGRRCRDEGSACATRTLLPTAVQLHQRPRHGHQGKRRQRDRRHQAGVRRPGASRCRSARIKSMMGHLIAAAGAVGDDLLRARHRATASSRRR